MSNATTTNATFAKHFERVEIIETFPCEMYPQGDLSVCPIWKGVDRPNVGGWGMLPKHRALATRLFRAIQDGAAFSDVTLKVDVNGKTYINASHLVLGRHMNADLKRLGY